jgi:hypothetical protein
MLFYEHHNILSNGGYHKGCNVMCSHHVSFHYSRNFKENVMEAICVFFEFEAILIFQTTKISY